MNLDVKKLIEKQVLKSLNAIYVYVLSLQEKKLTKKKEKDILKNISKFIGMEILFLKNEYEKHEEIDKVDRTKGLHAAFTVYTESVSEEFNIPLKKLEVEVISFLYKEDNILMHKTFSVFI